jgi:nitrogen fixation/metabolism regulation signal transduction histidine kinase
VSRRWKRIRLALGTRGGRTLAAAVVGLGAVVLFLLSATSADVPTFAQGLPELLLVGLGVVLLLMFLTGYQLLSLRRRLKQRVFGSRLTLRLVLLFSLVAVLPGALVYAVSVQFLARAVDTWFDVRVEKALDGGLALGRNVLDSMLKDLRGKADNMALLVSDRHPRQQLGLLNTLREQAGVQEVALIDMNGTVLAFSGDEQSGLMPDPLSPSVLRELRMQKTYSGIAAQPSGGLLLRVAVPVSVVGGDMFTLELVQRVPEQVSRNAEAVQFAHAEYQELAFSRSGLKRLYGLTLTLALLLALFAALLLAIFFSQRLSAPLGVLAEGTRAVAQGDYSQRTPVRSYDELGILTQSFNAMTRELAESQGETQRYQNQLESAKASLESILATLSAGVISLDGERRLRSANPSASHILGLDLAALADVPVRLWAERDARLAALAGPLALALDGPEEEDWQGQIAYPGPRGELTLLARASIIRQATRGGVVVVFDDITDLLKAQRQAAWGEVARRLAHEIKNPLTPIQLSAERLQHRLHGKLDAPDAEMLARLTQTIVNQVAALKGMVDAFSQYARTPETRLKPVDLGTLTREVLGLYDAMGSQVRLELQAGLPPVLGDTAKLRQVIHNLLRNAEDAVGGVSAPTISVCVGADGSGVALSVSDNGPGFPTTVIGRAFEPYVTTKPKGTGLGLAIVQKIIEEHHGRILLENLAPVGARVTIALPAAATAVQVTSSPPRAANA